MLDRFFAPASLDAPLIELSAEESHHLAQVLRKKVGDQVCLFDGQGRSATASIETAGRRIVSVKVIERHPADPQPRPELVLAVPLPRGDRSRWLVEKATELGVSTLVPLHTARSVVDPRAARLDKLRQTVIAACKQCGRNRLLEVREPRAWPEMLAEISPGTRLLVADRAGVPVLEALSQRRDERLLVAVGPEGGFTAEELAFAAGLGAESVSLGPHVLRIETAAVALSALVFAAAQFS